MTTAPPIESRAFVNAIDVTLDDPETLKILRDIFGKDDKELTPVRLVLGTGHAGAGLYLCSTDYPELLLTSVILVAPPVPVGFQLALIQLAQSMLYAADHGRHYGGLAAQYRNMLEEAKSAGLAG